jgi:hypothetical protein
MSEQQKIRRAKRLLTMAERAMETARAELAASHQKLHAASEERQSAERRLHEDNRCVGASPEWMLAELDQEARRRDVRSALEQEKKADAELATAKQKAAEVHQKHRVLERFHDNISDRFEGAVRRKEALDADAFALAIWSRKTSSSQD